MKIVLTEAQLNRLFLIEENMKIMKTLKTIIMSSLSEEFEICNIEIGWDYNGDQPKFEIYVSPRIAKSRSLREDLVDEAWMIANRWGHVASSIFVKPC